MSHEHNSQNIINKLHPAQTWLWQIKLHYAIQEFNTDNETQTYNEFTASSTQL